ncbi:MAG: flavodoxin-dependent (E)-4-hydroxy-3-methylbut-2-enyl-diphosphate synthase [Lachnospiraceae bacterium]|jgi:(E)-4-hydroxy-3-methylbut-2-enyl-diphosphate synthase|nr:flavodoxin-dependent (E)-4-hydroxy-3-methylbut-2-enyl-diphosphate synthase [Lachnospiraceae bacterium]
MHRNQTRKIRIGDKYIGGGSSILIQSMTNTKTEDITATVTQIHALEAVGCDIVRVAVPTLAAAAAVSEIKKRIGIPLVGDVHFDHRLAIAAIRNGVDKIRINPGNIGDNDSLTKVVNEAKSHNIPIRVGVNSGSLEAEILAKHGGVTAEGLIESALAKVCLIEARDYRNIVIAIKSSDVLLCRDVYLKIASMTDYPLHVGITEAGGLLNGSIKSAIAFSMILGAGIGDTVRVSLTDDPVAEIKVAQTILRSLGLFDGGIEVISCPTCGRTRIDLIKLVGEVEAMIAELPSTTAITVAVMGCVVNGPGEAREADLGIVGGDGVGLVFKKGEIIRKVKEDELLAALREEILNWRKN